MAATSHYRSNVRDIEFNLFEVLGANEYYGEAAFSAIDHDQARFVLDELDRFVRTSSWSSSFAVTDREPLHRSDEGDVTIPQALHEALTEFYDAGWHLLPLPTDLGGGGAPPTLRWAATELLSGSHATASLWPIGPLMAGVIDRVGTAGQRDAFALPMIERRWGGTMVLTEPDAGSDVGAGVTRARRVADNDDHDLGAVYHLHGVKRFITSADCQTHENTIHLVLARPEGAGPGTKGLSLFIVPKLHVSGPKAGQRNGVRITGLEHKLGIRGSATCEITLGVDDEPCVGYLAGDVHDGIAQMFQVIEYARMMVGTKAMATLSTGYLNALDYAKTRIQGADMAQSADKHAPKVAIIRHPDVRRMLMEQKAHAEGMRALVLFAGWVQDQAEISGHAGHDDDKAAWLAREDLLLPMVKGYCSEKAFELLALSLQVFGGSGYTQDYPIEQYLRDAKIDTLYEGTTGIQALDLLFRKIARDQGATLGWLVDTIRKDLVNIIDPQLVPIAEAVSRALDHVLAHLTTVLGHALAFRDGSEPQRLYVAGLHATALLFSWSEVVIGWLLLRQATVAHQAAGRAGLSSADQAFYAGKLTTAAWFAHHVLPKVELRATTAAGDDGALMRLDDDAW